MLNYPPKRDAIRSQSNPTDVANVNTGAADAGQRRPSLQQLVATDRRATGRAQPAQHRASERLTLASTSLNNIEQVDTATAITQLNTLQTQLQASYQTINVLQSLSLANYLK